MPLEGRAVARERHPAGTRVNPEAGAVDGVVSLVLDGADGKQAATAVLTHLRTALPASELTASLWRGERCVGSHRLGPADVSRLVRALVDGLVGAD